MFSPVAGLDGALERRDTTIAAQIMTATAATAMTMIHHGKESPLEASPSTDACTAVGDTVGLPVGALPAEGGSVGVVEVVGGRVAAVGVAAGGCCVGAVDGVGGTVTDVGVAAGGCVGVVRVFGFIVAAVGVADVGRVDGWGALIGEAVRVGDAVAEGAPGVPVVGTELGTRDGGRETVGARVMGLMGARVMGARVTGAVDGGVCPTGTAVGAGVGHTTAAVGEGVSVAGPVHPTGTPQIHSVFWLVDAHPFPA